MNERDVKDMRDQKLVDALREHAKWAEENQWETPITLSDGLAAAADLIEKLTDRCARYAEEIAVAQERTRWVPVEERLPEDPVQKVLVFVPHPHGNIVDAGRYLGADGWVLEGWCLTQSSVTHWMPLPDGPEEE